MRPVKKAKLAASLVDTDLPKEDAGKPSAGARSLDGVPCYPKGGPDPYDLVDTSYDDDDEFLEQLDNRLPNKKLEVVALDVEMVTVVENGKNVNKAAIVSLVDQNHKYLDRVLVRRPPGSFLVNFGSRLSGINTRSFLANGQPLSWIQDQIRKHKDKLILVCGNEYNDFGSLELSLADFSVFNIQKLFRRPEGNIQPIGLAALAEVFLNQVIQKDKHCPTIDAKATIDLYIECYVKSDRYLESSDHYKFAINHQ